MSEPVINVAALEPLFAPHEEPNQHRARAQGDQPAQTKKGRRPSKIAIAQSLRSHVKQWRETDYPGASDTTRELLHHWFGRDHLIEASGGLRVPFRYYFCQREAMETLIYLYEVRGIRSLTPLVGEFGGPSAETAALGVNPDDDRWAKYAFKLATGAGKTKVMSLAIVWSYFHALRESNSPMAKHFVVVAPNLTVFERLKTDFKPAEGGKDIFDNDPLIPVAWRGDWNLSVVLQDEASGAATGGTLYLTNIHRLYDHERRKNVNNSEWTDADDAVACLLPVSARNNRILHIDGDSFFASCEIALDPKLEGRPVWVGGGRRGDGIVIAANRSAKKFGIKTGTACFEAKRLCPSGVLCRPHYDAYRELSRQMFLILEQYAPTLVPYSIDEGFLDFSTMDW